MHDLMSDTTQLEEEACSRIYDALLALRENMLREKVLAWAMLELGLGIDAVHKELTALQTKEPE